MTTPKYKIGDTVITKAWFFYNLYEVIGGFWEENYNGDGEWHYTLSVRYPSFLDRHISRTESKLLDIQ